MAQAYSYAAGKASEPYLNKLARAIESYGVHGVLGRPIGMREIFEMEAVRAVVLGKVALDESKDKVKWNKANPFHHELISMARELAMEEGYIDEYD
ncbi:MAG: hypothetical protein JRD89_14555 [Deltaproteobacteria bacterium]|nr:hypothetical protein [Deltaproteobacteria bacterium]